MESKSSLKKKFLRAIVGGALVAGLLPATSAFAVATFPSTGSCAMLVTQPVPVGATVPANAGYNILAVITFTSATAATLDFTETRVDYTTGGYTVNATHDSGANVAVTIASLPASAPSAARSFTFTPTGSPSPIIANAIAVNGGSTILIQGSSDAFSGVCQF